MVRDPEPPSTKATLAKDEPDRLRHLQHRIAVAHLQREVGDDQEVGGTVARDRRLAGGAREGAQAATRGRLCDGVGDRGDPQRLAVDCERTRNRTQAEAARNLGAPRIDPAQRSGERVGNPNGAVRSCDDVRDPAL